MNKIIYDFIKYFSIGTIAVLLSAGVGILLAIGYDYAATNYPDVGEPIFRGVIVFILGVVLPASFILAMIGDDK